MSKYLLILLFFAALAWSAKPMESVTNYNVIMVHGAADNVINGFECEEAGKEPYKILEEYKGYNENPVKKDSNAVVPSWEIGGAAGMIGSYVSKEKLTYWLDTKVFEDTVTYGSDYIYIQRSFTNPAGSPKNNAYEIGYPKWSCKERRSLIEEAQEVKARGRNNLSDFRKSVKHRDSLPPSRNILVAHSMGGVASREYVQGDFYNDDVDKVVALDSPHEGTGALNLLLDMNNWPLRTVKMATELPLVSAFILGISDDITSIRAAVYGLGVSFALNATNYLSGQVILSQMKGFDYKPDDPLVKYIDPNSDSYDNVKKLQKLPYRESLPMMRLLGGKNSMTFTDPNESWRLPLSIFIPNALTVPFANLFTHISGNETNAANFVNSTTGFTTGFLVGITVQEHGTALVPSESGIAKSTSSLNGSDADVQRVQYDAAINAQDEYLLHTALYLEGIGVAILAIDVALSYLFPEVAKAAKIALGVVGAVAVGQGIGVATVAGIKDIQESHEMPIKYKWQNNWKGASNTYSKILGGQETIEPYQMEEFLYEKPFVNLRVKSSYSADWKDQESDTLGLYIGDSLKPLYIAKTLENPAPLTFKSSSHWETMGAKKERWEMTTGVGNEKIPIRHADRYPMPSVMVTDFIRKYEFEVDDLMPHRLRQIRLNFNFNEELAWECDVNKAEGANDACIVYKRTPAGPEWVKIGNAKHPVNKNGLFTFEPDDYYGQLGIIQKDNQNTVTVSTVNKIGLKNSQRFYYMFRATADLLEPVWPLRDIKISSLDGFGAYISTLDYPGLVALGGKEFLTQDPLYNENFEYTDSAAMSTPLAVPNGYVLKSLGDYNKFHGMEGRYVWNATIETGDASDPTKSSVSDMVIPFTLDITPPYTNFKPESDVINADSSIFLARFENDSKIDESLRLVALFLKNSAGQTIATAKFTEVLASSFSIKLPDFKNTENQTVNSLPDGKYKIASYAFDGSTGSLEQYNLLNNVINGSSSLYDLFENNKVKQGIIASRDTIDFIADSQAPEFNFSLSGNILNQSNLLKITLNVSDLNRKDSATARFSVSFAEGQNTLRLGDTLLLRNGTGSKEWNELESMAIPDGDYEVFIDVWDESGNHKQKKYDGLLRIDRTPPDIANVWSDTFIYADSLNDYSANMEVKQPGYEKHLSEMQCRYRINNGEWQIIAEKPSVKIDTLRFNINSSIVGNEHGKRRLEAGCTDWVGNFASKLDFFHVGARFPDIVYPNNAIAEESVVAIRGSAPTQSSGNLPGSYQIEWRKEGDAVWQTSGIDVGARKRYSADSAWISRSTEPEETDLGFFDMSGFQIGNYELLLSVRNCDSCQWRKDSISFYYLPKIDTFKEKLLFTKSSDIFTPGEGSLLLSLQMTGAASKDYRAKIYAHDSKGNALFLASADSLAASPFAGKPDSFEGNGVWFWSEDDAYYLRWKNLPEGEEIAIHYTKGKFDESICGSGCSTKDTMLVSNEENFNDANLNITREILIPPGLDKAMIFNGTSGELSFKSDNLLWLKLKNSTDTTHKVHLGKGGSPLEYVVSYAGAGTQIKKDLYGMYYKWNGMSSTGRYPQGQTVTFYAEVLENIIGGKVLRDSIEILITMPNLKIISDTAALDDFYVIKNSMDSGSVLGNKTISYGIIGRDAVVNAYVKKAGGKVVKKLLIDELHAASGSNKAYTLSWNGDDENGHLVLESGSYYFEIEATESGVSGSPQSDILRRDFEISLAPGVHYVIDGSGEIPTSSLSLLHADSVNAAYWQYAPVANYLVEANATGKWLPDSLRNIEVEWTAGGTQNIYGYPPQRYSLAVKRQRETLPLVIVTEIKHYRETSKDCWYWNENDRGHLYEYHYDRNVANFDSKLRKANFQLSVNRRGLDFDEPSYLTLYAFLLKDAEGKEAEDLMKNHLDLKVWEKIISLPGNTNRDVLHTSEKEYVGCSKEEDDTGISGPCIYTPNDTTPGYNPNLNLFESIELKPIEDFFYTDYVHVNRNCEDGPKRHRWLKFSVELTIPDSAYWNIGYGYDNLVNRTIRLDQTNKTIYGKDGFLKTLHDSTNISARNSIFFDGENWHPNYNYGMLTPFEMHKYPFISVRDLPSNNAFTFPDETSNYRYRSYYHAKFYNQPNENAKFRTEIRGQHRKCNRMENFFPGLIDIESCAEWERIDDTTLLYSDMIPIKTKLLEHGSVNIYVSMDAAPESFHKDTLQIAYPAKNWVPQDTCPSYDSPWLDSTKNKAGCKKFYKAGSKIHYGARDFTDKEWNDAMLININGKSVLANIGNSSNPLSPFATLGNPNESKFPCGDSFNAKPSNYENGKFYFKTDCISSLSGVEATYTPKILKIADTSLYSFADNTLYINAYDWDSTFIWPQQKYPEYNSPITLQIRDYFWDDWVKEFKLTNATANHLNSSKHTHFKANPEGNSLIKLSVKDTFDAVRPSEFIAVKGIVPENSNWKLSYLNDGALHTIAKKQTGSLFEWFNVNTLQGNTSILLQWGGEGNLLNIRKLDLDIGHKVTQGDGGTVKSLFGEVSVWFPPGSMEDTIVTVRTANATDYAFTTSNNTALVGPVIEVLPSKKFPDTLKNFPRVKARISQQELRNMSLSPDEVRLYKIDTENKKFVELENTLRGFDVDEPKCSTDSIFSKCSSYRSDWSYLLISAETHSFSIFAVLDTATAKQLNEEPIVTPDTVPSQIICSIPQGTLWLGLDNGYLEMSQECNQLVMGTLQLRKNGGIVAERSQVSTELMRWDGYIGLNKIPAGEYSSRYIAVSPLGSETQQLGPTVLTDPARPQISEWSVEEHSELLDRSFAVRAKIKDNESGIKSVMLKWNLGGMADSIYLTANSAGYVSHQIILNRNNLSKCLGCKLTVSLIAEDFGRNHSEKEWVSGNLYPYPASLALWYPALEGGGRTAREYTNTGHDLDLLMQNPWLSASGIYFEKNMDRAPGKGQVNFGSTDSYTLEAWLRPGRAENSAWQRVLGFNSATGKRIELQINGKDARLLDGSETWTVLDLPLQSKAWNHLIVAVDANHARFYVDGKQAGTVAAAPSERLWFGEFSLGTKENVPSFIGHIMQVRFYKRALEAEEALALFRGMGTGEDSHSEIALAGDLDLGIYGFERGFSCAIPGSSYWETPREISLPWRVWAAQGASYKAFFYARSAQPGSKAIKAGLSGNALASGTMDVESVWRPVELQGIDLPLRAGFNDLEFRVPAGLDIAGIAISDNPGLLPSQISWKSENGTSPSTVDAQLRFEGHPDPSMLRPRIRLQNIGSSAIYGPKVRYYFRGEDPAQVQASKFYPQEGELAVRIEGDNLGYAEWSFPQSVLPSGQLLFWGEGPHFGLHNANYVPWVVEDDVPGIIVLDAENRPLSGFCFENEHPLNTIPAVQVFARDSRSGDNQASQLYIKLENIGQVPVRDYEARYSFYVPGGIVPVLDVYDMQGLSASLKNLGFGRWQVLIAGSASLGPRISWANPAQFALHLPGWQTGWQSTDDPSHEGLSNEWSLAKGIEVFDAAGNRIYGKEPAWQIEPANNFASAMSSVTLGTLGTEPMIDNPAIEITRLPEGLSVSLLETSNLRLDLVDAAGTPQGLLYNGTLSAGKHIIPANWSIVDIARTYLAIRLNGQIIPSQLLSKLEN